MQIDIGIIGISYICEYTISILLIIIETVIYKIEKKFYFIENISPVYKLKE